MFRYLHILFSLSRYILMRSEDHIDCPIPSLGGRKPTVMPHVPLIPVKTAMQDGPRGDGVRFMVED